MGRPLGLAGWLTKNGLAPTLTYEGDAAANVSGGERRGSTYGSDLHVQLMVDGGRLAGMPGFSAYLDGLWITGGQPSRLAGDAQGVSNIEAPHAVRLYEAWMQYNFPGNVWSILAGRYDLNTEFYRLSSAGLFLSSSFGIGPEFGLSGFGGPSVYPDTAAGVRLAYKPGPNSVLRAAILDGAPVDRENGTPSPFDQHDGVLLAAEAAWLTRPGASDQGGDQPVNGRFRIGRHGTPLPYDDKIAVGAWYYTARFDDLAPIASVGRPLRSGEEGGYLLMDRLLFQPGDDPARRLSGFVQIGVANGAADRFGTYIGVGLALSGAFSNRPDDEMGLAMAMARNGSSYLDAQRRAGSGVDAAETAVELTYLAPVASWFAIQPDVQYVIHPDTNPRLHGATVLQMRFELTF
jgi:porin